MAWVVFNLNSTPKVFQFCWQSSAPLPFLLKSFCWKKYTQFYVTDHLIESKQCCMWFLLPRFVLWILIIAHNLFVDHCLWFWSLEEKERAPLLYSSAIFNLVNRRDWLGFLGINCKAVKVFKWKDLYTQMFFVNLNLLRVSSSFYNSGLKRLRKKNHNMLWAIFWIECETYSFWNKYLFE